jgi:hypothetical protein
MPVTFESWLKEVEATLATINMPLAEWQSRWTFDFSREFTAGTAAIEAAKKAHRFWWLQQNKALGQECRKTLNCWLPRNHQDECQPL